MTQKGRKTVLVAMSGGVDSSVAAALLLEKGYRVIGVTMKLFCYSRFEGLEIRNSCCSLESVRSASSVAEKLDIPHTTVDMEEEFREEVLRNFFTEYSRGRTPNPCILCNSLIKFAHLYEKGKQVGANMLATGHYARIGSAGEGEKRKFTLMKAVDQEKDQSYFLWKMSQEVLSRTVFPVGDIQKTSVREKARELDLEVADRSESQDFCFLSPEQIRGMDRNFEPLLDLGLETATTVPGPIVDLNGDRIGTHDGVAFYTTGQRHGLGIALGKPAYVIRINAAANTLTVGFEEDTYIDRFTVSDVNWVSREVPNGELFLSVKVRSRSKPIQATVTPLGSSRARVDLHEPKKAVTPGQSAVWYDGDTLIGGGVIDS